MLRPLIFGMLCAVVSLAQSRLARAPRPAAPTPVVVELFTSEGCSSCPAADKILATLDHDNVIVLGEHVDYWDSLGWKDRFSSPLFSSRQQDYGAALKNGTIYTPQIVVNGGREALGSDLRAVMTAVTAARRGQYAEVSLRSGKDNTISIRVAKLPPGSHKADVLLAITESGLESSVSAGENTGQRLRHAAVVRSMSRLAELDPNKPGEYTADARLNLKSEWVAANLKVVLLVQDRENRHILGAASLKP